jgi:hypothetical protein
VKIRELDVILMRDSSPETHRLLEVLRRNLPLVAYPRRAGAPLQKVTKNMRRSDRCLVTNVFDAGSGLGLMCQVAIEESGANYALIVTPITDLSFERRHPIARIIANYRRSQSQRRIA